MNEQSLPGLILSLYFLIAIFIFVFGHRYSKYKKKSEKATTDLENALNQLKDLQEQLSSANSELLPIKPYYDDVLLFIKDKELHQELLKDHERLAEQYREKKAIFDRLVSQIELTAKNLDILETGFGIYENRINSPFSYKNALKENKEKQKELIGNFNTCSGQFAASSINITNFLKFITKLATKSFNSDFKLISDGLTLTNYEKQLEKILKSEQAINRISEEYGIYINPAFKSLKIEELNIMYGFLQYKQAMEDDEKSNRERLREEEKVRREVEKALAEIEKQKKRHQEILDKLKADEQTQSVVQQIQLIEHRIVELEEKEIEVTKRQEIIKSGYVYIISNIRSFGENVFKIGMTRRLDPMDRIRELGDASVPFPFDVHALIFTENAPDLEGIFHNALKEKRVNILNNRKEFFRTSFEELSSIISANQLDISLDRSVSSASIHTTTEYNDLEPSEIVILEEEFPDEL